MDRGACWILVVAGLGSLPGCGWLVGADFDYSQASPEKTAAPAATAGQDEPTGSSDSPPPGTRDAGPSPATPIKPFLARIDAADDRTCVLTTSGDVKCWGEGWQPRTVLSLDPGVIAIAVSRNEGCALHDAGALSCWTSLGLLTARPRTNLPSKATSVVAGRAHLCALLEDGAVACWGTNAHAQLGDGTLVDHDAPVKVVDLGGRAVDISAGGQHSCAVLEDRSVRCWGSNDDGQLGDGTRTTRATPVTVEGLTSAIRVIAGGEHTCAMMADGLPPRCWGNGSEGRLGNGTKDGRLEPTEVANLPSAPVEMIAGDDHTCARLDDGAIYCWGDNTYGQLGDRTTVTRVQPTVIPNLEASALGAGDSHTCALLASGGVDCWGLNEDQQLGVVTSQICASKSCSKFPIAVSDVP